MNKKTPSISIIIPLLEVPPYFCQFFEEIEIYLTTKHIPYEIIIIFSKGKKRQALTLSNLAEQNPHVLIIKNNEGRSIAHALRAGIKTASKNLICFYDGSFRYDIECLDAFLVEIEARDYVLGYRFPRNDMLPRKLISALYRGFLFGIFGINRKDINCSMKIFKAKAIHEITLESKSSAIYLEMVYKLQKRSQTYFEIPIVYLPKKMGTRTHFAFRESIDFVVDIVRLKFNL